MGPKAANQKLIRRRLSLQFSSFRSLPSQRRTRYLLAASLVVFYLYWSFKLPTLQTSVAPFVPPVGGDRIKIQASFPVELPQAKTVRLERQKEVKEAFLHAWKGYKDHAWLHDEVMPLSGDNKDPYVGWAATLVDALDTLWIMDLQDEFEKALSALKKIDFSKPNAERVPVFETTIRYLGGMLGAYDISEHKYPILLEKATQLGDFLYGAFNTELGLPVPYYLWEKHDVGKLKGEDRVLVAQIGSLSLEFIRLSQVTGDDKYAKVIQRITDQLEEAQNQTALPGMWPSTADYKKDKLSFSSKSFTLGAWADSLYEYLPKTHLLLQQTSSPSSQYKKMYESAYRTFSDNLFFRPILPGNPDILFAGTLNVRPQHLPSNLDTQIQHLGCFVGGMVALGSKLGSQPITATVTTTTTEALLQAEKLTNGCFWAYENTASGIMPEISYMERCTPTASTTSTTDCDWPAEKSGTGYTRVDDASYQLRPEAIESIFIMYRLTADTQWQEKAWKMFVAVQKHTRTKIANARLMDVMVEHPVQVDSMESFWLAETLKYFYLVFSEAGLVDLDSFVLNTEAHPFRWWVE